MENEKEIAEAIHNKAKELNELIIKAEKSGLTISVNYDKVDSMFNLGDIKVGSPGNGLVIEVTKITKY